MTPISAAAARALVGLWRHTFPLAPASVCLTLMEIESHFNPAAHAIPNAAAIARGVHPAGAWGLLQLLQPTAADMVKRLSRMNADLIGPGLPAAIRDALTVWDGAHPECLTNAALGSLLGVAYLDQLAERFGPSLDLLAAAYHNGPGFLRDFLAAGKKVPGDMPPRGLDYVLRARAVWPRYADADVTPPLPPAAKDPPAVA